MPSHVLISGAGRDSRMRCRGFTGGGSMQRNNAHREPDHQSPGARAERSGRLRVWAAPKASCGFVQTDHAGVEVQNPSGFPEDFVARCSQSCTNLATVSKLRAVFRFSDRF